MTVQLVIYLSIAGQEEILGVREFSFPPRVGELLQITHQGEVLKLQIEQVRHRVDEQGHMAHLVCARADAA
ncbi:hypothetical protein sphantq_02964 [Sphingobium sp. AntQ-1]|uniref:hypothetical protein n=1 Tax=Sphingobium sp. AntQ-1 TaxID=2930091 RepID=UPI00234F9E68|nr:hypothetical protein [Sphingobium sp. AntQ-1]WCP14518.1 hypothetical protein sphantq_02964 [Sphingobium sp. AntQ-1]